jgi:hypothetical protein
MKPFLMVAILMATFSSLALGQTAVLNTSSPIAGTWKANLAKSQRAPNHQFQSLTLRFDVSDDAVLLSMHW